MPRRDLQSESQIQQLSMVIMLSAKAKQARILKDLTYASLISLGQLADDGCKIEIDAHALTVSKDEEVTPRSYRNRQDGLYDIPIYNDHPTHKTSITQDNYVVPKIHSLMKKQQAQQAFILQSTLNTSK